MFPRVLYVDNEKALELNWFGLGSLQARSRSGGIRRAHPIQKQVLLQVVAHFEALGQPVHPSNPKCSRLMKEFSEMLSQSPSGLIWQTMYQANLKEVALSFTEEVEPSAAVEAVPGLAKVLDAPLAEFIAAASECANEMLSNASYIEKELPSFRLTAERRVEILGVCAALVSAKHDVISELHELHDLSALTSNSIEHRVKRILDWLSEELAKLHAVVTDLQVTAGDSESPYILVAESAVNILNAYTLAADAAKRIGDGYGPYRDA